MFSVQDLSREPDVDKLASRVQEVRQETDGETDEDEDRDKDGEDGETDGDEDGDGDVGKDQDGVKGGDEDRDKDGEDGETDGDEDGDGDVGRDQDGVKGGDEDEVDGGGHTFFCSCWSTPIKTKFAGSIKEHLKENLKGRQWKNCRGEVSFTCGTKKTERWCANATERKQRTRTGR